ncbi:hypothetical protein KBA27_05205 [bacterium]|nr:hypothetical protein [bacterium]
MKIRNLISTVAVLLFAQNLAIANNTPVVNTPIYQQRIAFADVTTWDELTSAVSTNTEVNVKKNISSVGTPIGASRVDSEINLNNHTIDGAVRENSCNYAPFQNTNGHSLILKNGTISNFSTTDDSTTNPYHGGVIFNNGADSIFVALNTTFSNNTVKGVPNSWGGVIANLNSYAPQIDIEGSSFIGNIANDEGGAIFNASSNSDNKIVDSYFQNNKSLTKTGGAIYNTDGTLSVENSYFYENTAVGAGAIKNDNSGNLTIKNSIFDSNSSTDSTLGNGSAIYNDGILSVENSTFKNNKNATGTIGTIYSSEGEISFLGNTFTNNEIKNSADVYLTNGFIQKFENNTFTNSLTGATDSSAIFLNNTGSSKSIQANTISNYTNGIKITNASQVSVSDNNISNTTYAYYIDGDTANSRAMNANVTILAENEDNTYSNNTYDIYAKNASIRLTEAKDNQTLRFNDKTAFYNCNINLQLISNINNSKIVLNNTMNLDNTSTLRFISEKLQLGDYGNTTPTNSYINGGTVFFIGGEINSINGVIDSATTPAINIKDLTISSKTTISMDLGDYFKIENDPVFAGANAQLGAVNVVSDVDDASVAFSNKAEWISGNAVTYTNNARYVFTPSLGAETLSIDKSSITESLKTALTTDEHNFSSITSFSATSDYSGDGGQINENTSIFNIFGNNKNIVINTMPIIKTGESQILNIYNVKNLESSTGQMLSNDSGTVNIYDTTISNGRIINTSTNTSTDKSCINLFNVNLKTGADIKFYQTITGAQNAKLNIYNSKIENANVNGNMFYIARQGGMGDSTLFVQNSSISGNNASDNIIKNEKAIVNIEDSDFKNNTVTNGNPIFNTNSLEIDSNQKDVTFSGNTAAGTPNDIFLATDSSCLYINPKYANRTITLADGIASDGYEQQQIVQEGPGTFALGGDNSTFGGTNAATFSIENGTVQMLSGSTYFGANTTTKFSNKTSFSIANGTYESGFNFGGGFVSSPEETDSTIEFSIDADMTTGNHDSISLSTAQMTVGNWDSTTIALNPKLTGLGTVTSKEFSGILNEELRNNVSNVRVAHSQIMTPIYRYNLSYDKTEDILSVALSGGNVGGGASNYQSFNPSVLSGTTGAQTGTYLTQVNSYEQAFTNADMIMALPNATRQGMKYANRYASVQGPANGGIISFNDSQIPEAEKGLWFRPYATFETIGLKNGPSVGNVAYGTLLGGDSQIISLAHGWDAIYSLYAGYNGSHQTFDGVGIYQNGGQIGGSALFMKGKFFTGLTANVGASSGDAHTMYGTDNFTMLATGVASKTGYNFEINEGKFIIQPSFLMSYSFVNTFDYTNAAGVSIHSDPLNAIQIVPGIKFIGNTKKSWQPYASVQMVWNIMDKAKFFANDVSLPEMSVKPYIQYGLGLQKRWGEKFTAFGEAMIRNGGRSGIALQFGFRWSLGKGAGTKGKPSNDNV